MIEQIDEVVADHPEWSRAHQDSSTGTMRLVQSFLEIYLNYFLPQYLNEMLLYIREKARGGIAAWDCSASHVLTIDTIDHLTTNMDFSADILARAMFFFENKTFSDGMPTENELDEDVGFALYFDEKINGDILLAFDNTTGLWGTVRVTQLINNVLIDEITVHQSIVQVK